MGRQERTGSKRRLSARNQPFNHTTHESTVAFIILIINYNVIAAAINDYAVVIFM